MQTLASPVLATDWHHLFLRDREKALTTIYYQSYPVILHYVKQHNGTPEDAQDLLQEAVILFYEKTVHGQLTLTSSVTTYLMGVCKNLWRQELEKRHRQNNSLPAEIPQQWEEPTPEPENPAFKLVDFVNRLGKKCQDILTAFYYFGHPMPRIAEQHQYRNVHTATVQKFKCLERLRKSLAAFSISDIN